MSVTDHEAMKPLLDNPLHSFAASAVESGQYELAGIYCKALSDLRYQQARQQLATPPRHDDPTRMVPKLAIAHRTELPRRTPGAAMERQDDGDTRTWPHEDHRHDTCIETTNFRDLAIGLRTYMCGPDCPTP